MPWREIGIGNEVIGKNSLQEARSLAVLAGPLVLTQLSQMGMSVIDFVFTGRVGVVELAGVSLGTSLFWPVSLLATGVLVALTATVAQLYGADQINRIGAVVRQAGWIAMIGAIVVFLILFNSSYIFELLNVNPVAIPIASAFLKAQSMGIPALFAYFVFRNLCDGMARTELPMYISLSALALKVPLTYLFVVGGFGFEGLGGVGCGVSTAILMWFMFFALLIIVSLTKIKDSQVFARFDWPHWGEIFGLVRLGVPIGLSIFAEVAFFSAVALMIGQLAVESISSHQIAMNIAGFTFMFPLAYSMASTIRVGGRVGAEDYVGAQRSGKVAVGCVVIWGVFVAVVFVFLRTYLVSFYSTDSAVVDLASKLLLFAAFFQIFDCAQVVLMGSLRGYRDVTIPMFCALVSYWIVGMPLGTVLTFGYFDLVEPMGVEGFWWGLISGLCFAWVLLTYRFSLTSSRFIRNPRWRISATVPR